MLLVGLSFAILGRETHGRPMGLGDAAPEAQRPAMLRTQAR
jgi:hypothetical protein